MDTWLIAERLRAGRKAEGWDWQPGTYRCDEGWNDTSGASWGCRATGAYDVDGRWLCWYHSLLASAAKVATPSW